MCVWMLIKSGTKRNCCTQRLVILHAQTYRPTNELCSHAKVVVVMRLNVSLNTLQVISGMMDDFYRPDDQTNSVSAEGNQLVVEIRLESHQNHSTML